MKEAAGEANLTVIAIVLIAIVAAVATPLISNLMRGTANKSCCLEAGGQWRGNACTDSGSGTYDDATYQACVTGTDPNGGTTTP